MIRTGLIAIALTAAATLPAHAVFCLPHGDGVVVEFGFHIGEPLSTPERNEMDLMALQRLGVDATFADRWNGCIRAFVRKPEGGEEMQFFDPDTYERVQ